MAAAPPSRKRLARWIGAGVLVGGVLIMGFAYYIQTSRSGNQLALGRAVYEKNCTSCHGVRLEGQPGWQRRLPSGRMPAPPHDASGHTWHHPDAMLFGITKHGPVPGKYASPGYQSDMPGFRQMLFDDEIWDVLAYVKSHWPAKIRQAQREINSRRER